MVVLLTCENEEDPIKIEGHRVVTTFYIDFSDAQGQLRSVVWDGIWPKFKLIQVFKVALLNCTNEEDQCKMKELS